MDRKVLAASSQNITDLTPVLHKLHHGDVLTISANSSGSITTISKNVKQKSMPAKEHTVLKVKVHKEVRTEKAPHAPRMRKKTLKKVLEQNYVWQKPYTLAMYKLFDQLLSENTAHIRNTGLAMCRAVDAGYLSEWSLTEFVSIVSKDKKFLQRSFDGQSFLSLTHASWPGWDRYRFHIEHPDFDFWGTQEGAEFVDFARLYEWDDWSEDDLQDARRMNLQRLRHEHHLSVRQDGLIKFMQGICRQHQHADTISFQNELEEELFILLADKIVEQRGGYQPQKFHTVDIRERWFTFLFKFHERDHAVSFKIEPITDYESGENTENARTLRLSLLMKKTDAPDLLVEGKVFNDLQDQARAYDFKRLKAALDGKGSVVEVLSLFRDHIPRLTEELIRWIIEL